MPKAAMCRGPARKKMNSKCCRSLSRLDGGLAGCGDAKTDAVGESRKASLCGRAAGFHPRV